MRSMFMGRVGFLRHLFFASCLTIGTLCCAGPSVSLGQSTNPEQSNQAEAAKPAQEKSADAAQAAAKSSAHHFDRVVVIVLENGHYEAAVQDKNLAALAAQGASFSNFHALFHPSYPNYLAMVAGTDFGIHRRGRFLADRQSNFANDAAHKTIADRLIAGGLDFKTKEASQQDPKALDRHYTHYSVLRTIEDNFALEPLAAGDRDAAPITDIWK